ncbi:MAG: hypothetical protein U0V48_03030 [Anaerolineales bacterium]
MNGQQVKEVSIQTGRRSFEISGFTLQYLAPTEDVHEEATMINSS